MDYVDVLASVIYGEAADQKPEVMQMVGSTVLNRLDSGRVLEFGEDLPSVIQKGYYAASRGNVPYQQAVTKRFPDEKSETAWKQAYAIASGLIKGTIERQKGQFYFTPKEIAKLKKNKKAFDFKKVREVGSAGNYKVFEY